MNSAKSKVWKILNTTTPKEAAYSDRILDVGIGAAASDAPNCIRGVDIGVSRDLLRGFRGVQAIGLSTATTYSLYGAGATISSAGTAAALPIAPLDTGVNGAPIPIGPCLHMSQPCSSIPDQHIA